MGDVLYQFFGFAFFNDTQLTLFQLQLGTGIEKPEKIMRFACEVISINPPHPAVTCGRAGRCETFTEPSAPICKTTSE